MTVTVKNMLLDHRLSSHLYFDLPLCIYPCSFRYRSLCVFMLYCMQLHLNWMYLGVKVCYDVAFICYYVPSPSHSVPIRMRQFHNEPSDSMDLNPSWEANRSPASQEIPCILRIPQVHYCIYKCLPPVPILARSILSMPLHPTSWKSILILSSHLCLGLPSCLPQVSPQEP